MKTAGSRFAASFLPALVASFFLCAPLTLGQQKSQGQQNMQQFAGSLTVSVRLPDGSPFDRSVLVNLYSFTGGSAGIGSMRAGQAEFGTLPIGRYTLEVIAPGYEKLTQPVEVSFGGQHEQVYITLTPESPAGADSAPGGAPILAPNAQKEMSKALEVIRANKPEEARKHLEKLSRAAPSNPDVNYLWGVYYLQCKDLAKAKSYWEKAVQIYPLHGFSLAALAQLALERGDSPTAIDYLGRAVEAAPSSWRFEERFAEAYLQHQEYERAQKHAEHAIELGKDRVSHAHLILAKALVRQNESQRALKALEAFLAQQPSGPSAAEAQRMLETLHAPAAVAPTPAPLNPAPLTVAAIQSGNTGVASVAADLVPPPKWMPPDIDESMPAVESGVACPLQTIQNETGRRVHDFVDSVNRISATESLYDEVIDHLGFPTKRESRKYTYVASVEEIRPGMYDVEEYRNGTMGLDIFPEHIATLGLTSLVMIFHPAYREDYEVSCEGLSRWHGGLAWQVHFRQRPDKPARLREYRVGGQTFPVSLRGRAWVAVDTFQVVSLETDVVAPIPQIRLKAEHTAIEYMPVKFPSHNQELWLPQSAELFFDFEGRRMHRRHHFRDYMLFSVDEKQKISAPKIEAETDPDSEANRASPH
jgi:thioredoxin-like negative regulator of GroEL